MTEKEKAAVKKWTKDWLAKWDGKCIVCGRKVGKADLWSNGMPDTINGAVVGDYIEVYGHRKCVRNVDDRVVIPNRMRVM